MLILPQIQQLSKKLKINTTVIIREYLQLLFLQNLYELSGSENLFFKGGTAIHFLMEGFRFLEDLDFTAGTIPLNIHSLVEQTVKKTQIEFPNLTVKPKKTLAGKSYLLTLNKSLVGFPVFISLDFSFREKVLIPQKAIIKTEFPLIFSTFVYYVDGSEILAEKVRAVMTRYKGRDLFDMWYLLKKYYLFNSKLIKAKMAYYPKIVFKWSYLQTKIKNYDFIKFKSDLAPFISNDKRVKIKEMFEIIKFELGKEIGKFSP